jgi:O-methyltransferase
LDLAGLARRLTRLDETEGPAAFADRWAGLDWPATAETMVGVARLLNIVDCLTSAVDGGVAGGFAECGVWRGGACIMAAATLRQIAPARMVWACDSFAGLPVPSYPADMGQGLPAFLVVPLSEVKANFKAYGLLSKRVRFVEGWFADSLPGPVGELCVLRCDGDMYGSTWETLEALYDHVQPGGFVIVDDYGVGHACKTATDEFRFARDIDEPLWLIENGCGAVYWQKGD